MNKFYCKHKKIFAALVGFFEVSIFIFVISRVITNLNGNIYGVLAYGARICSRDHKWICLYLKNLIRI